MCRSSRRIGWLGHPQAQRAARPTVQAADERVGDCSHRCQHQRGDARNPATSISRPAGSKNRDPTLCRQRAPPPTVRTGIRR